MVFKYGFRQFSSTPIELVNYYVNCFFLEKFIELQNFTDENTSGVVLL